MNFGKIGMLAKQYVGVNLPLTVMKSQAGYYIGTVQEDGPCSRESAEYWPDERTATEALAKGDWTQRLTP